LTACRSLRESPNSDLESGHINNLYNTTFWAMVQKGGIDTTAAEGELKGTVSSDKNEILFSRYDINYNNEPEIFKKGSVVFREYELQERQGTASVHYQEEMSSDMAHADSSTLSKTQMDKLRKAKVKGKVVVEHLDVIRDDFWERRPWILSGKPGRPVQTKEDG